MRSRPLPERASTDPVRRLATGCGAIGAAATLFLLVWGGETRATTIIPVAFDDMVRASGSVVVARVTNARTTEVLTPGYRPAPRRAEAGLTRAPLEGVQQEARSSASQAVPAPVSAGIKPGRVLFTHLTLVVEETIKGRAPATLNLRIPGGTFHGTSLVIEGLPMFQTGERYLLFLRPDAEQVGDPVVGVNQGFFHVVPITPGQPAALVTDSGDYVIAIEKNRVVVKAGPERAAERPVPPREPLPDPDMGFSAATNLSDTERRYWESAEPPMTVAAMAAAVRAVTGWERVVPIGRPGTRSLNRTGAAR